MKKTIQRAVLLPAIVRCYVSLKIMQRAAKKGWLPS